MNKVEAYSYSVAGNVDSTLKHCTLTYFAHLTSFLL